MVNIKVLNILTKTVGAAGLGLVLYDAHVAGKINASARQKNVKAENLAEAYKSQLKLDSPSIVKSKAKEEIFRYRADENLSGFFTSIGGYFRGLGSMLVGSIIPLALSLGTFFGKKGGKQIFSKCCGAGLLAYGGIFLLQEGFGIGKHK